MKVTTDVPHPSLSPNASLAGRNTSKWERVAHTCKNSYEVQKAVFSSNEGIFGTIIK